MIANFILAFGGWMPMNFFYDKCQHATVHFLGQYWPTSMPPFGITRTQWLNHLCTDIASVCEWICCLSNISVAGSCYISGDPMSYTGNLAVAEDGSACLAWTATSNVHYDSEFPDGSVTAASNFCRNPYMFEKPYCYINVDRTFGNCNVALCDSHGK